MTAGRRYAYAGTADVAAVVRPGGAGRAIGSAEEFAVWVGERSAEELAGRFLYTVGTDGVLRLAPWGGKHVVCAGGGDVLGAGGIGFARDGGRWRVWFVGNHSTGYRPDGSSWAAVARALDRAGLERPEGFTREVVFRRCGRCGVKGVERGPAAAGAVCGTCGGALREV